MPSAQPMRGRAQEKLCRKPVFELGGTCRLKEVAQVAAHELRRIRLVCWQSVEHAVRIVQRNVKQRAADQRRQPRHLLLRLPVLIEPGPKRPENLLLKLVPYFKWMTDARKSTPCSRQLDAEFLEHLMPCFVVQFARPNPLNAERRFAPSLGAF